MSLKKLLSEAQSVFTKTSFEKPIDFSENTGSPDLETKNSMKEIKISGFISSPKEEESKKKKKNEKVLIDHNKWKTNDFHDSKENFETEKMENIESTFALKNENTKKNFTDLCVTKDQDLSSSKNKCESKTESVLSDSNFLNFKMENWKNELPVYSNFQENNGLTEDSFFFLHNKLDNKNFLQEPFFTKKDGLFSCRCCSWTSKYPNFNELNDHMKTYEHQEALKNRFHKNESETKMLKSLPICEKKLSGAIEKDKKQSSSNLSVHFASDLEIVLPQKKLVKKEELQKDNMLSNDFNTLSLPSDCAMHNSNSQKPVNVLSENMIIFFKMFVLGCIQLTSENEMKCILCNKLIQIHQNCEVMMRNITTHIQSKNHIHKLLAKQKSLKLVTDDSSSQDQRNIETKYQNTKNIKKEAVVSNKKQENVKNASKVSDNKLDKILKFKFLCTTCNHFGSTVQDFSKHEQSQTHKLKVLEQLQSKVAQINDFEIKFFCQNCSRFIIGPQDNKMKHVSKCGIK